MHWFEIYFFRLWAGVWKVARVAGRGTEYRSQTQGIYYLFIYFLLVCSLLITVSKKSYLCPSLAFLCHRTSQSLKGKWMD